MTHYSKSHIATANSTTNAIPASVTRAAVFKRCIGQPHFNSAKAESRGGVESRHAGRKFRATLKSYRVVRQRRKSYGQEPKPGSVDPVAQRLATDRTCVSSWGLAGVAPGPREAITSSAARAVSSLPQRRGR